MTKSKQTTYPPLLSSELLALIDSLSLLRGLVMSDEDAVGETVFCQWVADTLTSHGSIKASCVYLSTGSELHYAAGSGRLQEEGSPLEHSYLAEYRALAQHCWASDAVNVPGIKRLLLGDQCALGVALAFSQERVGSIVLIYRDTEQFQPWHEQLFKLCADIVAQSLLYMRLICDMRVRLSEHDLRLNSIDAALHAETQRRRAAENALQSDPRVAGEMGISIQGATIHTLKKTDTRDLPRRDEARTLKQIVEAIERDTFELHCQPILRLGDKEANSNTGRSGEVLVRMRDEHGGLISGGKILPHAERYGFSSKLDQRVVAGTLNHLSRHRQALDRLDHLAINLSAHSIGNREFLDFLVAEVTGSNVDPTKLCFEVTETAAILDVKAASYLIGVLKELGCTFALDDFGTGYASYLYLRNLDVDYLKIDGEFVRNMAIDRINHELVRTMVDMGKILGKQTVAEFVEDSNTLNLLQEIGVDLVQGYLIGRPKPIVDFLDSL